MPRGKEVKNWDDIPSEGPVATPARNDEQEDHIGVVVDQWKREFDREGCIFDFEVVVGGNNCVPREKHAYAQQKEKKPSQIVL